MSEHAAAGMMDKTIEKMKTLVNTDTVIGTPVQVGEITVIPVSKVTYGFASGGSDLPSKNASRELFGGGGGVGVTITPTAFLTISGGSVRLLPVNAPVTTAERLIEMVPEAVDKLGDVIKGFKKKDTAEAVQELSDEIAEKAAKEINENL